VYAYPVSPQSRLFRERSYLSKSLFHLTSRQILRCNQRIKIEIHRLGGYNKPAIAVTRWAQ